MRARPLVVVSVLASLYVLVSAVAASAQAEEQLLDGKFRSGPQIVIDADEVVEHDLYAAGGRVTVDGTVDGDLIAAGGEVIVRGTVTGDANVAGGTLRLPGTVEGTLRAAGGEVVLRGEVSEDVVATGGTVRIAETGAVGGDFVFTGGQVTNHGDVGGNVLGRAGQYTLTGTVAGTEDVVVAEDEPPSAAERIVDVLQRYLSLLLVAAVLLAFARRPLRAGAERIQRQPLPSLGLGLGGIVGAVVAFIIAVIVVVLVAVLFGLVNLNALAGLSALTGGVVVGALVLLFVVVVAFVAQTVVGLWLGRLVIKEPWSWIRAFGAAALGLAVIVALVQIPFAGPVIHVVLVVLGIGGMVLAAWNRWRTPQVQAPEEPRPA